MPRYRMIVIGRGIHISVEDGGDSIIGFVAPRFIKANTEEDALKLIRRNVLVEWRNTYNRENKVGVPTLSIGLSQRVRNPFKLSRPNSGYSFFSSEEGAEEKLAIEKKAGSNWFL